MRREYGTTFITFVIIFVFQTVILSESLASFYPGQGNYGAAPKNTGYQIGTSIQANTIREESDPQAIPYQFHHHPSGISYGLNNHYDDNFGQVALPESGYYNPVPYSYGSTSHYDPRVGRNSQFDPSEGVSYIDHYSDPGSTSYNGPNAASSYFDSSYYPDQNDLDLSDDHDITTTDSAAEGQPYDPHYLDTLDDPDITTDAAAEGESNDPQSLADLASGLDLNGIMSAIMPSIIERLFGSAGTASNPLSTSSQIADTSTFGTDGAASTTPFSTDGAASTTTFSTDNIDDVIGQTTNTTPDAETATGNLPLSLGTEPLPYASPFTDNFVSHNSSHLRSMKDTANHFNSRTEGTGESKPMLIFTPNELNRSKLNKGEYSTQLSDQLSDEEIAKLYNLIRKKKMLALLLTDGDDKNPHGMIGEIQDNNRDARSKIENISDYYHYIHLLEDLSQKSISSMNQQSSAEGESSIIHSAPVWKDYEDQIGNINDYYEIISKGNNSSGKPAPGVDLNLSAEEKPIIIYSARARKDNGDFMRELSDFHKIISLKMDSSEKPALGTEPNARKGETQNININSSKIMEDNKYELFGQSQVLSNLEINRANGGLLEDGKNQFSYLTDDETGNFNHKMDINNSKPIQRGKKEMIEKISAFNDFISIEQTTPKIEPYSSEGEKSSLSNSSQRFRKHNRNMMENMREFYDFIPFEMDPSIETAPGIVPHLSAEEKSNLAHSEQVQKLNKDKMKNMSEFYDFIPLQINSFDKTVSQIEPHLFLEEDKKSSHNDSQRFRKHDKDIIENMRKHYDFIPIKIDSFEQTETGIEPNLFKEEKSSHNDSQRFRKHDKEIIENMRKYYDFIPVEMDSFEQTVPRVEHNLFKEQKSNHNDSQRFRKDGRGIMGNMSRFYEFIPTEIHSSEETLLGIQHHPSRHENLTISTTNEDKIMNIKNEKSTIYEVEGSIKDNKLTPSPIRFYRMIPKTVFSTKSGIDSQLMHSPVKEYFLEDLKSKSKSNYNLSDKLLLLGDGLGCKDYLLTKKQHYIAGGIRLDKTCPQSPKKYIFRLTCYDPHSHSSETDNKSYILHFDCLKKMSPLITNILKNVENHHYSCSSDYEDSSKTHTYRNLEQHKYDTTEGSSEKESYSTSLCSSSDEKSTYLYDQKPTLKKIVSPVPIDIKNKEGFNINNLDLKSTNSHTNPSHIHKETSSEGWQINNFEQYGKYISDGNVFDGSTKENLRHLPTSLPIDSSLRFNSSDDISKYTAPKHDLDTVNSLPKPHSTVYSEQKHDGSPKSPEYKIDSHYPPSGLPIDSSYPISCSCEMPGARTSYSTSKPDSNTSSCSAKPHTTSWQEIHQLNPTIDASSTLTKHEIEPYNIHGDSEIDSSHPLSNPDEIPEVAPLHSPKNSSNIFKHNFPNSRSNIMTMPKLDHNKPYVDKLKNLGLQECKTIENVTIVIEKRISDAIETLLNSSLQSCYKDVEIPPSHLSIQSGNATRSNTTIITPVHLENIDGESSFNDSIVYEGPQIGKCHLKQDLSTKHTKELLKDKDTTKLVQGFECKKTIQSNHCRGDIGPSNSRNMCSICNTSSPPASKECETLANFLEKISLTLDKNCSKGNDSRQ